MKSVTKNVDFYTNNYAMKTEDQKFIDVCGFNLTYFYLGLTHTWRKEHYRLGGSNAWQASSSLSSHSTWQFVRDGYCCHNLSSREGIFQYLTILCWERNHGNYLEHYSFRMKLMNNWEFLMKEASKKIV